MVQAEFARILADPLELSRQWSREGRKVVGCLDSYIPEEFIHAAGMTPLRFLGSTENVVLADSYLPVFAGKLARSILEQALQGNLAHLAGVAISNSSDAVRMLYDLTSEKVRVPFSLPMPFFLRANFSLMSTKWEKNLFFLKPLPTPEQRFHWLKPLRWDSSYLPSKPL